MLKKRNLRLHPALDHRLTDAARKAGTTANSYVVSLILKDLEPQLAAQAAHGRRLELLDLARPAADAAGMTPTGWIEWVCRKELAGFLTRTGTSKPTKRPRRKEVAR